MPERHFVDVDFEYDKTDPTVVEQKARESIGEGAYRFQVDGWKAHEGRSGGYFRVWYYLDSLA